jgi:UDP-glucose 4-epimerase
MTKVLITGSSGFIGSWLIKDLFLQNSDFYIYALTRKETYSPYENLVYIKSDLTNPNFTDDLPEGIDLVMHLAQSNNYRLFPEKVFDIFDINIASTQKLLEWSRKTFVKKFIFASTGNVYARKNTHLIESDICFPEDYYGRSKLIAELLVGSYKNYFSVCILRIFGVYGPGQTGMIIPNIIQKVKNHEKITLAKGKGLYFSPLFIVDCIQMIKLILEHANTEQFEVFNLSGPEIVSLDEVISATIDSYAFKPEIEITNSEPAWLIGSSEKFICKFNFHYSKDFKSGVKETLLNNK